MPKDYEILYEGLLKTVRELLGYWGIGGYELTVIANMKKDTRTMLKIPPGVAARLIDLGVIKDVREDAVNENVDG